MPNPNHEPAGSGKGGRFARSLTPDQENALEVYGSEQAQDINEMLRLKAELPADLQKVTKTLDKMIENSKTNQDLIVYRGVDQGAIKTLDKMTPGRVFRDVGFVSTSLDIRVAQNFGDVVLQIRLPKGTPALDMTSLSGGNEQEILVGRGHFYRFTGKSGKTYKFELGGK